MKAIIFNAVAAISVAVTAEGSRAADESGASPECKTVVASVKEEVLEVRPLVLASESYGELRRKTTDIRERLQTYDGLIDQCGKSAILQCGGDQAIPVITVLRRRVDLIRGFVGDVKDPPPFEEVKEVLDWAIDDVVSAAGTRQGFCDD